MPVPSIESVNSTSASNIGDLLQEGDFQKGAKITAFVFLMLLSMLGNALLIYSLYTPFQSAVSALRTATNGLSRESPANCFAVYHSSLVKCQF